MTKESRIDYKSSFYVDGSENPITLVTGDVELKGRFSFPALDCRWRLRMQRTREIK